MYVAKQHQIEPAAALDLAHNIGVGHLITSGPHGPNATFVPFNIASRGDGVVLQAHLNRVNTQWKDEGEALMVVHGPNARISGLDFPPERPGQKLPTVPTWNYVTVHLRGTLTIHDDEAWKSAHLEELVSHFEDEWRVGTHSSYELVKAAFVAIVGVEIEVSEVIGKAKLGQNLSPADIEYTAGRLRDRDAAAGPVADLMEEIAIPWAESREERVSHARHGAGRRLDIAGGLAQ